MADVRVILFGVGRVGKDVARLLHARPGFQVVAAYSRNANLDGQELFGIQITNHRHRALLVPADVAVIATTSFLRDLAEDIRAAVRAGLNVICTGEEMLFPWIVDRSLANDLDKLSREHQVTILGAGANPGFIFDALVLTATGAAWDVESIHGRRVVNCSISAQPYSAPRVRILRRRVRIRRRSGERYTATLGFRSPFHFWPKISVSRLRKLRKPRAFHRREAVPYGSAHRPARANRGILAKGGGLRRRETMVHRGVHRSCGSTLGWL